MLTVCIPPIELWDETKNEFVGTKGATIQLEHSLVAISKWESRWNVPFLTKDKKTPEQLLDYIKCMTITQNVPQDVFNTIPKKILNRIVLDVIFDGFKIDVSYMTDEEYDACLRNVFDKLKYRQTIPKDILTGEKFMEKSVNIGDQISQIIGIFYPHRIDTYVKFVRSQKYYGRYMDDWYLICRTKEELIDIYNGICEIAKELGIHINTKKTRIVKLCSSYKFLQVKYEMTEDGKLYKKINPKRVVCFRRKIKKLAIKVLEGTSTYENVENTFKSWMGAYYKLLTKVQRENLITLYEDLFNKRIDIVNKKMVITNKE